MPALPLPPEASRPLHPAQRRYLAEDLMRLRRSDEQRRYAAPQRSAKIDPNPHQIEAVIFALSRVREGGCILADEVGLGKTIEAGLVIAQLLAEGAKRVLLVAPKALLGQWRQELYQLFGIEAHDGDPRTGSPFGEGVFLIGREAVGSDRGSTALHASGAFDLCVVDEAHEVFAGIYKRYNEYGDYREDAKEATTAHRLRALLQAHQTPVLLLTATPIQNTLTELWGLVQYVDPLGTLLGDLPTFRALFCADGDRRLAPGQDEELRGRLKLVLKRTLRRQAQEFLEKPFVDRHAKLFEYAMSTDERSLYDDVTRYLLEPHIVAFDGSNRQLLLLGVHRRLASSSRALASSLDKVAQRLRRMLIGESPDDERDAGEISQDLEDDEPGGGGARSPAETGKRRHPPEAIHAELARVEDFIRRSERLGDDDSKFKALLQALSFVEARARKEQGAGKLVVFTESLVTQDYLRARLTETRLISDEEVTLFRGTNDSPRARQALERWRREVPQDGVPPSPDIAVRLALVHEFKTRSRVFISTEAGAKGLNLQFCDTVVNYDLPWNPQRIEQRIGRCHRYGQRHGVTVINFLARDNEAQRLTFEILSQKLELFGTVLSATDEVLHRPERSADGVLVASLGAEFEQELKRIYDRSRTLEEVTAELRALRERVDESRRRFEETHDRTADLIEEHLDEGLHNVFRLRKSSLPAALAEFDGDLLALVESYLAALGVGCRRESTDDGLLLSVNASPVLPPGLADGCVAAVGASTNHASLHLSHPLVKAAVDEARSAQTFAPARLVMPGSVPPELRARRGAHAHLRLVKIALEGFERTEQLIPIVVMDDGQSLDAETAHLLLTKGELRPLDSETAMPCSEADVQDAVDELLFRLQASLDAAEQERFERARQQAERFLEDRLLVMKRRRHGLLERMTELRRRQEGAVGAVARGELEQDILKLQAAIEEAEGGMTRLEQRDDQTFRAFYEHIHRRRYAPPQVSVLYDMGLVLE